MEKCPLWLLNRRRNFMSSLLWVNAHLTECLNSVLNVKAIPLDDFNQRKALIVMRGLLVIVKSSQTFVWSSSSRGTGDMGAHPRQTRGCMENGATMWPDARDTNCNTYNSNSSNNAHPARNSAKVINWCSCLTVNGAVCKYFDLWGACLGRGYDGELKAEYLLLWC